jgi:RimJ/RimL family protein N-acetyltransferase
MQTADVSEGGRRIDLGARGRLEIRPVRGDDLAGIMALYDDLSLEDRHLRFFCAYRPPPSWFQSLVDVDAAGGRRLVVEHLVGDDRRIVAEAGYVRLSDGNGDFAIVVDRHWRGWLGTHLLGELVAEAADQGVPNLDADVLTTNGPMLAVLRRRGAVVVEHDGWTTVRLRIGTVGETPTWAGSGAGRRVLVESPGGRWPSEDDARAARLDVLTCPGPGPSHRCPVLEGGTCSLVDGADVVVVRSPPGDERWAALLAAHRERHPHLAVILEELGTPGNGDLIRALTGRDDAPAVTAAAPRRR